MPPVNKLNLYRVILVPIFLVMLIATSACNDNDEEIDKLALLSSTSWLGATQIENFDYDSNNKLINQTSYNTPEGLLEIMSLYKSRAATIKYNCDRTVCTGDQYQAKWELIGNKLKVTINREELGSLVDAAYMESSIISLTASDLISEVVFMNPEPSVAKRVRRIKYVSIKQ